LLSSAEVVTGKPEKPEFAPAAVEEPDVKFAAQKELSVEASSLKPQSSRSERAAAPSTEGFVAVRMKEFPKVASADVAVKAAPIESFAKVKIADGEAVSAREFMLGNELAMNEGSVQIAPKAQAALASAETLGTAADRRVSHQAIDFVADKIDTLRTNGGGVLRVHLDPKDLGSVMLKVSTKGGIAKVEIVAEKAETAALFTQNRADLNSKLENSGISAHVSIDQGRLSSVANASPNSQMLSRANNISSYDLMAMDKSVATEALSSSAVRSSGASGGTQSSAEGGSGESWNRDERREFAREQRNFSRQNRKSA